MASPARSVRQLADVHATIEAYYTGMLSKHGATPRGVDWTCVATQHLRFVQLLKIVEPSRPFSLNDVGCGYGALVAYLAKHHADADIDYLGVDLSPPMVRRASRLRPKVSRVRFMIGAASPRVADYSVASGIFNVKLGHPTRVWTHFIRTTLMKMHATSRRGFAVNFLAPRAPGQIPVAELYRTAPESWVSFCERSTGGSVEVLSGYGLREFTLLVRP